MDKEMTIKAEGIVDRHIQELTLQLDNCKFGDDEYKDVVHTLLELNSLKVLQMNIRVSEGFLED
mgnify:FL=1